MSGFTSLIDLPWAQALASTLLHFLWQGAAIGLVAFVLLRAVRFSSAWRYGIGVATLAAMLIAPVATFAVLTSSAGVTAPPAAAMTAEPGLAGFALPSPLAADGVDGIEPGAATGATALPTGPSTVMAVVLASWLAGVLVLSVRLTGGWLVARRLATRAVQPVSPEILAMARRVAGRIALDRFVRFLESTSVAVPVTVGWMKPVVLLPAAAMTGLSTTQIEALLGHELAHIRRHDYLVNLMQSAIETLLFYHPAVWWASRVVRAEREHCCDDIAVGVCDRLVYVSALSDLASMTTPRLAMAATDGPLLARVRRLLGRGDDASELGSSWVPTLFALIVVGALVPGVIAQTSGARATAPVIQGAAGGVATGVPGGVVSGVAGGVVSGVSGRAVTGVRGSAATGVSGGIISGVSTGSSVALVSGVSDGVVSGVSSAVVQSDQRTEQERAARAEAARAARERVRELQRALAEVDMEGRTRELALARERAMLALEQSSAMHDAELEGLKAAIALAQQQMNEARKRVEVGVDKPNTFVELETRLAQLKTQVQFNERELDRARAEAELRLKEAEGQLTAEMRRHDIEMALLQAREAMEQSMDAAQRVDASRHEIELAAERAAMQAQLVRESQALEDQIRYALDRSLLGGTVVTDAGVRILERDVVVLEISGEADLPKTYQVRTDGNIRLPLLGDVQVRGLTAAEAKDLIAERLADRRLAEGAEISVTLRRPRSDGGR